LFSGFFGSKNDRVEEACELYKQAANNFKLGKNCTKLLKKGEKAAEIYMKCAECHKSIKSGEEVEFYMEAANMLRKINTAGNEHIIKIYIVNAFFYYCITIIYIIFNQRCH
jgi:hypothetical protein